MLNPRIISNGCHRDAFVACSFRMAVIRSLSEAVRLGKKAKVLSLRKSQDLLCCNLMCEKVGTPCICRLSRALDRVPHLKRLDLADNDLEDLPISLWDMRYLSVLDLSKNKLKTLSSQVSRLFDLKVCQTWPCTCCMTMAPSEGEIAIGCITNNIVTGTISHQIMYLDENCFTFVMCSTGFKGLWQPISWESSCRGCIHARLESSSH
eukprot:jgi/Botrbrau1/1875/Bobra.146_1s0062.1